MFETCNTKVCVLDLVQLEDDLEVQYYFSYKFSQKTTEQDPIQTLEGILDLVKKEQRR